MKPIAIVGCLAQFSPDAGERRHLQALSRWAPLRLPESGCSRIAAIRCGAKRHAGADTDPDTEAATHGPYQVEPKGEVLLSFSSSFNFNNAPPPFEIVVGSDFTSASVSRSTWMVK